MRESLKKAPRAAPRKLTVEIGKNCIAIYMNICVDDRICNINSTLLRAQVLVAQFRQIASPVGAPLVGALGGAPFMVRYNGRLGPTAPTT